jgi:hypothetical protein
MRKVWMVFMMVFSKEWGAAAGGNRMRMPDRRWDAIWVTQTARALFAMGCEAVYKVKRWGRAAKGEAMCEGLVACIRS